MMKKKRFRRGLAGLRRLSLNMHLLKPKNILFPKLYLMNAWKQWEKSMLRYQWLIAALLLLPKMTERQKSLLPLQAQLALQKVSTSPRQENPWCRWLSSKVCADKLTESQCSVSSLVCLRLCFTEPLAMHHFLSITNILQTERRAEENDLLSCNCLLRVFLFWALSLTLSFFCSFRWSCSLFCADWWNPCLLAVFQCSVWHVCMHEHVCMCS